MSVSVNVTSCYEVRPPVKRPEMQGHGMAMAKGCLPVGHSHIEFTSARKAVFLPLSVDIGSAGAKQIGG